MVDSECSRRMLGDVSKFFNIAYKNKGNIWDSCKLVIVDKGNIEVSFNLVIKKVLLAKNIKFNLLSVS